MEFGPTSQYFFGCGQVEQGEPTMTLNINEYQKRRITDLHLETLLETIDRLHDAAYQNRVDEETTLSQEEIIGWLEDIIYTAQETINELSETAQVHEDQSAINIANLSLIRLYRGG